MKKIEKIITNQFSRRSKLLKLGLKSGYNLLRSNKSGLKGQLEDTFSNQIDSIVNDFGLMKGSIMKAGQMLSLYSQNFLPEDLQKIFSQLENKSFYLGWNEIKKNIPENLFENITIDENPIAAASLGQVHSGNLNINNKRVAIKIQYKGVSKAINNDIKTLRLLLKLSKLVPKSIDLDPIFDEIKTMLYQEVDYNLERSFGEQFYTLCKLDGRYEAPLIYDDFCTSTILTTEFIEGCTVRDVRQFYDQDQINRLGRDFMELLFLEIFEWGLVQTDAHPGNYIIRGGKWVLIDFGATKVVTPEIKVLYTALITSAITKDSNLFIDTLVRYNYIDKMEQTPQVVKDYLSLIGSPYSGGDYDWGESEISQEVVPLFPKLLAIFNIKSPPKDVVFIDKKIGGLFFILKLIGANFNPEPIAEKYLDI